MLTITDRAAVSAVEAYVAKNSMSKALEVELKGLRDTLLGLVGAEPAATIGNRLVQILEVPAVPPGEVVKITRKMVGQTIPGTPGRKGYKQLRVA